MRINCPLLVRYAGIASGACFWTLFRTLYKDIRTTPGASPYNAEGQQRYLYSVWHDSAVIAAFGGRHSHTVALTSCHRDGSFVEGVVKFMNVRSVRGSSGRSGSRAARRLIDVAKTHDIVMTPDGPRGPKRTMSRGMIYLASRTGNAIVPTAFACQNAWEIKGSWTSQIIPKPFSRVVMLADEPVHVPVDISPDEIESYRIKIQQAMDALNDRAKKLIEERTKVVASSTTVVAVPQN